MSNDIFNARSRTVIALALTREEPRARFPLSMEASGVKLPKRSWVKNGQIRTISIERLRKRLGRLGEEELDRLIQGLNEIIGG